MKWVENKQWEQYQNHFLSHLISSDLYRLAIVSAFATIFVYLIHFAIVIYSNLYIYLLFFLVSPCNSIFEFDTVAFLCCVYKYIPQLTRCECDYDYDYVMFEWMNEWMDVVAAMNLKRNWLKTLIGGLVARLYASYQAGISMNKKNSRGWVLKMKNSNIIL